MKNAIRAIVVGLALSFALTTPQLAAEKGPTAAEAKHKVGDKVYICGCGKACDCSTLRTAPGKCHCGMDLIPATVTKVEGNRVTVKSANGEQVIVLRA